MVVMMCQQTGGNHDINLAEMGDSNSDSDSSSDSIYSDSISKDMRYSKDSNSVVLTEDETILLVENDSPVDNTTIDSDNGCNTNPCVDKRKKITGSSNIAMLANANVNFD